MKPVKIDAARAVVTGAGSGIGRATALRLARGGAGVVCVDIDAASAEQTASECGATARVCDVADADAVAALADAVESELGPVDILVNNAGVGIGGPFLENSLEDWAWLRGINLDGVVYGCHAFGARMVARGRGHIVNVASGAAYVPNRNMAAYCASKAAVFSLSQCLRADWASRGVGVSVVCPGLINTPIASRTRFVGDTALKRERVMKAFRFGHSPDLVAKAIVGAVERNREIVPVGIESEFAYRLLRFAPGPVQGLVTRAEVL